MVSHLFYDQLALLAILWLFIMLPLSWPGRSAPPPTPPAPPIKPKPKRSTEPKAFEGLTHKPPCALCEPETGEAHPPPPVRPDPMPRTTRRPRTVDTSMHFCPHSHCAYRGWLGLNNLRAHGHPNGGPWRQFQCTACEGYFPDHHGTIFHGKQAAEQLKAFSSYFLCDIHVQQVQLDELYAVLSAVKDGHMSEEEAIQRLSRSPQWVWTALDPQSKLLLAITIGPRTQAMAQQVLHQVVRCLAPDCVPLFLSDGFKGYLPAILAHFGSWVQPERRQATGPVPKPRWMPLPQLLYAQVVKTVRRRRLVRVSHRVVFGTLEAVQQVLAACGWQINTAFVERLNLTLRQHVAAIGRRVSTLCKGEAGLDQQLALYHSYYNFCLPHGSLRQPLPQPVPTNGTGSAKQWRPCTPAMAAGLTDHVWSLKEILLFRVPPWPRSCIRPLRIIHAAQEPATMP